MMGFQTISLLILCFLYAFIVDITTASKTSPTVTTTSSAPLTSSQKQRINFFAGGLAGTIASTLTAPLEVVKTQLQSSTGTKFLNSIEKQNTNKILVVCNRIMKVEGPRGFFRGIKPMLVGIIPTRAIYFWSYTTTKTFLNNTMNIPSSSPLNHISSAFAAGITSNTITNPLWLVKTRYQLSLLADTSAGQKQFNTLSGIIKSIYVQEGPLGYFKGLSASYIGCFEGAIQWIVYEKIKATLSAPPTSSLKLKSSSSKETDTIIEQRTPTAFEYSLAAASAKFVAILATYPHEVVRTRMREQATNGLFRYTGFVPTLKLIAKEEGMKGLYGGMGIHLLRSVPNAAVMFVTFELVSKFLETRSPSLTFPSQISSSK